MSGKNLVIAVIVSAVVSIAILLIRIVIISGSWPEYATNPAYVVAAVKAFGWFFLVGLLTGILTLFFAQKSRD